MKSWYRHPSLITFGLAALAIGIGQVLQLLLYSMLATGLSSAKNIPVNIQGLLALIPPVLATLAAGAFLGRLRPDNWRLWSGTALVVSLIPVLLQLMILTGDYSWLAGSALWFTVFGTLALWLTGCWLGSISSQRYPDPVLDKKLIMWSGGIVGLVLIMFGAVWGSVHLSKGYQLAKKVTLKTPPFVEIIDQKFSEPGVAKSQRFKAVLPAGDSSVQAFYLEIMENDRWINVTDKFQDWPAGQWQYRKETYGDQLMESQIAGAHWQDMSGNVAVTLVLQALKTNPLDGWTEGEWEIQGVILSRGYSEPEAPMKSPDYAQPSIAPSADAPEDMFEETPEGESGYQGGEP